LSKKTKNKKLKKQIRDAFILTLITCVLVYIVYIIFSLIGSPTDTFILKESTISSEISKVGYVIRDEKIIETNYKDKKIEPIKSEGERVAAKQPIFKYYNVNQEEITKQIDYLNNQIQEALIGRTDLFPSDVKALEGQIEKEINALKNQNNMQHINEHKNNISDYIVKKAKIAGSLSAAGTYINNLISQRNNLEEELTKGTEYVYSDVSGVVSYRIDNLESELSINNIENISLKNLENLKLTTGQIVSKSANKSKVINNFECYIAVGFNKDIKNNTKEGKKVVLRLSNKDEVNATIYKIKEDGNEVLVIFKITDDVEKLINYRKISLDVVWWSYTGLMAPKSSILYENGKSYIMRKKNGNSQKILVKILKENDNYCIIDNYDSEELAELGYTTDEIDKMKTIKIYDEIIVNPELE